ncbi:hypothetical protein A2671_00640 [Candidatus Kaiserbacteria bacterium RIFCSPHIGHO2_01_FULL_49_13]|uniref:Homing endonuclease LAGLIDADG domain-containing protein n=1 Tax=Candidatus Kaiserbacteria bacterium RIFCSPHIGHO2_01_FULL_49_13 TaxID=1798477 RepID=A0A1F6CEF9_9BACT|nr:MAG: hypothetical protein A2671_00640 [Candidatus Kaiserbacteria bacterium RIFCSPHIGHO2_01_FULL_49_13]
MNGFKEQCLELRKKDYTLPEIVKITGRSKTSVYFHIRDFPLSVKKLSAIRELQGAQIRVYALARKGKSVRGFRRFSEWNRERVLLVSHLLFDGEIYHGGCAYNNRSSILIEQVAKAMKSMYDFEPKRYKNPFTGVSRIAYYNVALGAYVKIKARELLQTICHFPKSFKREFLQSFFDDEGCMDFRPENNCRRIRGYQKDAGVLKIIQKLLLEFEITSRIQMPNEVVIVGKENLVKFQREINFSRGVRINGMRSNSIWKQSLEKREILRRAIASYQT